MPRLAVLGQPIAHSRSPAMHNAALAELGLAGEWSYEAIEVAPEEFEARVRAMPGQGFAGANVTVPHKLAALRVADEASEPAREIGAANTLTFSDGRIAADNTDATGFLDALPGDPAGGRALVLGAGGSARAVVWALASARRRGSRSGTARPRGPGWLAEELGVSALGAGDRGPAAGEFDLLVNCTTVGMGEGGADLKALPLDADAIGERHIVVDLAYGPAETELVRAARARGAAVIDGLEVLVRQGAASLRIWTGLDPPIETMRQAARQQDGSRESPPISEAGPRPGARRRPQTDDETAEPGTPGLTVAPARALRGVHHRRDRRAGLREPGAGRTGDQRGAPGGALAGDAAGRAGGDQPRPALARDRRALRPRPRRPDRVPGRHGRGQPAHGRRRAALPGHSRRLRGRRDPAGRDGRPGQRARARRHPDDHRPELPGRGRRRGRHRGADHPSEHARACRLGGGRRRGGRGRRRRDHRAARVRRRRPGDQARPLGARAGGHRGRLRHPLRARRGRHARPLPGRRRPPRGGSRAEAHGRRGRLPGQDHERPRHRREASAAGRPRQRERRGPQDRPSNHDPADPARRGLHDPHPRQGPGAAHARRARAWTATAGSASRPPSPGRTARSSSPARPARESRRRSMPRSRS